MKPKFTQILAEVTRREGKRSSMKIGDLREAMAIVRKMCKEDPAYLAEILKYFIGR